ncbi:MAG TPA: NFACT RNA binding domain-containing protein [Pyrinomonadaceae bacterium]|nr:NFACT RNA binding domain-containing protein [Pyrinomonadaceae bacterium]
MNDQLIAEVVKELAAALVGRAWGKIFQLSAASLAVDFRAPGNRYLFVSVEPNRPRLHLVARTVRELEKASVAPAPFALVLRKALGGAALASVTKDEGDRVVRFLFDARDAVGEARAPSLVAQLTGRTSNLFLLDERGLVLDSLRPARGEGQEAGEPYRPPARLAPKAAQQHPDFPRGAASLSEALDRHYQRLEHERAFDARAAAAAARIRQEAARLQKLRDNLARDLAAHGDAEAHKRAGDLLLANLGTAVRRGALVRLTDFYAEGAPEVELEVEEHRTLQEAAAERFARYGKAKRAAREIAERLRVVERELAALDARRDELGAITAARDEEALATFAGAPAGAGRSKAAARAKAGKQGEAGAIPGVRRYRSSDGLEILVGRGSRDNDQLTFRVARSFDTWLHAADYPGSHVVVRHRRRDDAVPHRTLVEAAQLAAHFSRAKKDSKVAVNYTQRKFVSKPKGAAPGLVYLSSFRTLMVEPREEVERI